MIQAEPRKRYVDSSKVQEHHAIIPTKQVPSEETFKKLTHKNWNKFLKF